MKDTINIGEFMSKLDSILEKDSSRYFNYWSSDIRMLYFEVDRCEKYQDAYHVIRKKYNYILDLDIYLALDEYFVEFLRYHFHLNGQGYKIMIEHQKEHGFDEIDKTVCNSKWVK